MSEDVVDETAEQLVELVEAPLREKQIEEIIEYVNYEIIDLLGYCGHKGRRHKPSYFELRYYDSWYATKGFLRWFFRYKKCRYCDQKVKPRDYDFAKTLESLKEKVREIGDHTGENR
ncbi:hypothetical protein OB919_16055 [Halobacteria archaeon AArc-curdl1]|uniref:Uncharacterized protein n=1 Tax=Natronosalvus hydrolyticus TaxID=2979988 RepID=A0AAP2ZA26_9EURY|nr:hypothetical protein [Halobacteria archaeon AArc-curdl1]